MTKKQRARQILDLLAEEYPLADCTLQYDEAWKLLVSVRLAAQCTDARVNIVVKDLFARYPSPQALAEAAPEEIEEIVKPCGLGKSKARDIHKCMKVLVEEYDGQVPEDFDQLLKLPGVGRKSANLIMGDVFGRPAIVTDTHCIRLTNRMGLVDGIKNRPKWKKNCGRSFRETKEVISVTGLFIMEELYVQPETQNVSNAVWHRSARKFYRKYI